LNKEVDEVPRLKAAVSVAWSAGVLCFLHGCSHRCIYGGVQPAIVQPAAMARNAIHELH